MGFLDSLKSLFGGKKEKAEESQAQAPGQAPAGEEEQAPEQTEGQEQQRPPEGSGV